MFLHLFILHSYLNLQNICFLRCTDIGYKFYVRKLKLKFDSYSYVASYLTCFLCKTRLHGSICILLFYAFGKYIMLPCTDGM